MIVQHIIRCFCIFVFHQFFCILHFCHTCSLCRVELVVQFPARGLTQVLLCLFPGVLWLWHFLYSVGPHPVSSLHIYSFVVSRAFMAGAASQAGDADSSRAPGLTSGLQGSVNNPPMIMKLHALAPHESRMCPTTFGVKGQRSRSWGIDDWKWFLDHNWPWNPWNFMHLLLISQGCALLISGYKGQEHGATVIENGFWTITDSVIHLWSWNFIHLLPMSQGCALNWFRGQRSDREALVIENSFRP